jgi:hypothetical protein
MKEAKIARAYFNNSFIDTSRITVEYALPVRLYTPIQSFVLKIRILVENDKLSIQNSILHFIDFFLFQYGSEKIPRAWSKYSKGSSAYSKLNETNTKNSNVSNVQSNEETQSDEEMSSSTQKQQNLKRKFDELADLKNDPQFQEFLSVTKKKPKFWANDETFVSTSQPTEQIVETKKVSSFNSTS